MEKKAKDDKYIYNKFGSKGVRVGQAVYDIISKEQAPQTVEETIEAFGPDFSKEFQKTVENNINKYKSPFFVLVLTKKEMWACNMLRNFFIARQTAPFSHDMVIFFPNYTKTLYKVNSDKGDVSLLWSIPGHEECKSISKSPQSFDPQLVKWIQEAYSKLM